MNFSWRKLIRHLSENVLKNVRICEDFPASFALIPSHSSRSTKLFHQPCILAHRVLFHDLMRISRVKISMQDCLTCVAKSGSELFLKIVEWLDGTNPTWWITSLIETNGFCLYKFSWADDPLSTWICSYNCKIFVWFEYYMHSWNPRTFFSLQTLPQLKTKEAFIWNKCI